MPPDGLDRATVTDWLGRLIGSGELPPPSYRLHLHPREGQPIDGWTVRSFALHERLHAPYALTVLAVPDASEVDVDALLGGRVCFEIVRGELRRTVHAVVLEAALVDGSGDGSGVELRVAPAFALLGLSRRSRVFQGRTVLEIAAAVLGPVLAEHGGALCVDRLMRRYEPRDYCVQYRETDLDFVLRILAAEGITVLFDHGTGVETVVLVDDNEALPNVGHEPLDPCDAPPPPLPFVAERADELPMESIGELSQGRRMRTHRGVATAWDWKARPGVLLRSNTSTEHPAAVGSWSEADEGRPDEAERTDGLFADGTSRRALLHGRRDRATATVLCARSNATALRAGSVFELLGAPLDEYGETWVVTAVQHHGTAPRAAVDGSGKDATPEYGNAIECQPLREPVVPPRMPRPQVMGVHSAIVTGPPGEAIHTDRFGRVRVRMLWDEQEHDDEPTSCWLRVATPWAGDGFGSVFIPRVGTEVIVSFIDGDPDRPFCSASVYGGGAMPPYALPEHRTRTVLRTQAVGGDGHNELSFDDAAGKEEVFLHAHRNLREEIVAHHATEVGRNQTLRVDGSRHASIGRDDTTTTAGEHRHTVDGQVTERYRSGYVLRVGESPKDPNDPKGLSIDVTRGSYDLRADAAIVLRCGESRLELHPDRIVLCGPRIETKSPKASIVLDGDAVTVRANKKVELGADVLAAVSTSMTVIKGPTCELGGVTVGIEGERISIEASARVDIAAQGEVDIRGTEMIKLNC